MPTSIRACLLPCLLLLGACGGPTTSAVGSEYRHLQALLAENPAFVKIGVFHLSWPATVSAVRDGADQIEFTIGGQRHGYPGYDGYDLRVVELTTAAGEAAVVLRSQDKR